jgi:SWI/SNF-related matrix-associated actin-dependent regulator of chromatin subfamily A-like protein 1
VAILSITALGTGFTLTAASTVIFAELFWTPAVLIQAEDRTHRIGQQQSVNIHYLVGDKTLDPIMLRQLERKIGTVARVLDGEAESLNMEVMGLGEMGKFEL